MIKARIKCPSCHGVLSPCVLACGVCDLRIEGNFSGLEFDRLDDEMLHFLRIFIHCEGCIRDMEAALGMSYPTVKSNLRELRKQLGVSIDG